MSKEKNVPVISRTHTLITDKGPVPPGTGCQLPEKEARSKERAGILRIVEGSDGSKSGSGGKGKGSGEGGGGSGGKDAVPLNINQATAEELAEALPRCGEQTSLDAIKHRQALAEKNDGKGFESVEQLTEVGGISEAMLEKAKRELVVEDQPAGGE